MFKHLLVPLDGSRLAEAAVPLAAALAGKAQARVTLLHVIERAAPPTVHGDTHLTSAHEAQRYLERIASEGFAPEIKVDWHVHGEEIEHVAQSVAEHAHEFTPDLIVMASHGHPRLTQRLFGTIPQQIIQRTSTPVLLAQAGPDPTIAVPFRRILVPLDGQAEHEAVLSPAAQLARLCDATLRLVMVIPTRDAIEGEGASTAQLLPGATELVLELEEESGAEYLARHVQRLQLAGVCCTATIARGNPVRIIDKMVLEQGADLVALATHGAAGTKAFWSGSMGQKLIGHTSTSLLLVFARPSDE